MSVSDRWRPLFPARSGTDMARMLLRLILSTRPIGNEVDGVIYAGGQINGVDLESTNVTFVAALMRVDHGVP